MATRIVLFAIIAVCAVLVPKTVGARSGADAWAVGVSNNSILTEHWDGNSWTVVPAPNPPDSFADGLLGVVEISPTDVWAAGNYTVRDNGDDGNGLLEQWNGSSWNIVPDTKSESRSVTLAVDVAPSRSDEAWLVGLRRFACRYPPCVCRAFADRYYRLAWHTTDVQNPSHDRVNCAGLLGVHVISKNDVWAVGHTTDKAYNSVALVEHWDGAQWGLVPTAFPHSNLFAVTGTSDSDIWVSGDDDNSRNFVAHWNGSGWTRYHTGYLVAITEIAPNDVWAVGTNAQTIQTLVEHWDGVRWSVVSSPNVAQTDNWLESVSAANPDDVWAVGDYEVVPNQYATLIEHWDGTSWTIIPSPSPGNSVLSGVSSLKM